jgi:hypothetical protein
MDEVTEEDWSRQISFRRALTVVEATLSQRKARLVACAVANAMVEYVAYPGLREMLSLAEKMADGDLVNEERVLDNPINRHLGLGTTGRAFDFNGSEYTHRLICGLLDEPFDLAEFTRQFEHLCRNRWDNPGGELVCHRLVRETTGNPFRPVRFGASWRTVDTLGLARGIYEDRAFDRMPLLADALMDAGCDDEQIISHCRTGGPHVRGCWVVDLVLGKE